MKRKILGICLALALLITLCPVLSVKADGPSRTNRFNVVFAIDNSGSMSVTDAPEYRFTAVQQFIGLLSEDGNKVGGVLFAPDAYNPQQLKELNSLSEKNAFIKALRNPGLRDGGTNIGAALSAAHNLLEESGNPELPSVIVLLSDGNTELKGDKLETSLQQKAEAVQKSIDLNVPVYAICLNVPNSAISADPTEMESIARATNGAFMEVANPSDLSDTFSLFYDLIYGTSAIKIADTAITEGGTLETAFSVPSFGVSEVNLIVYGNTTDCYVSKPDGGESTADINKQPGFTMVKIKDTVPGTWTLHTNGANGEPVRVNMVINADFDAGVSLAGPDGNEPDLSEILHISDDAYSLFAVLRKDGTPAQNPADYESYAATLLLQDAVNGSLLKELPMTVEEGQDMPAFTNAFTLRELTDENGAFNVSVRVEGFTETESGKEKFFEKTAALPGTLKISTEELVVNHAPVAAYQGSDEKITLWPFRETVYTLDIKALSSDEDGDELYYTVTGPFTEGEDYVISEDWILTQKKFSFRSGTYKITATDPWGESCTTEVNIRTVNVTVIALLGMLGAGLLVAAILVTGLIIALKKPFYGEFEYYMLINGSQTDIKRMKPRRGRLKLKNMKVPVLSRKLDYAKSYFQAEGRGKRYVTLVTNYPVSCNGPAQKTNRFESEVQKGIVVDGNQSMVLFVKFKSRQKVSRAYKGGAAKRPAGRPSGNRR